MSISDRFKEAEELLKGGDWYLTLLTILRSKGIFVVTAYSEFTTATLAAASSLILLQLNSNFRYDPTSFAPIAKN